jgi:hypothetical protein
LINRLATAKNDYLNFSSQTIKQYPKRITALLVVLMLGGGGGSFVWLILRLMHPSYR